MTRDSRHQLHCRQQRVHRQSQKSDRETALQSRFHGKLRIVLHRSLAAPRRERQKALQWLKELPFPGNIRELKNLVERTDLVSENEVLKPEDFLAQAQKGPAKAGDKSLPAVGAMTLDEMEASMIKKSMAYYHNNISKVARALGVSRAALYRRLEKFGIPYESQD